jgi:predicted O-methyltransferase YrrM
VWDARHDVSIPTLDAHAGLRFAEDRLRAALEEFDPPREPPAGGYGLLNPYYGPVDADVLYAMIRAFRPRRVLELGGGYSSLVAAEACARNGREGSEARHTVVDPQPRAELAPAIEATARLERRDAATLPLERFTDLAPGDVLFVDTSHVVERGGEVNRLVLEVLPRLAEGVLVHFHDIFLPYEYPRSFFARGDRYTEQYLLQAYLTENPGWEVLFAAHLVWRERREALLDLIPATALRTTGPAAFWMRRTGT